MGRHLQSLAAELPGSWVGQAECGGRVDLEPVFFPERGAPSSTAIAICHRCPVRADCLDFALRTSQPFGIWGGTTARERHRILRRRRGPAAA